MAGPRVYEPGERYGRLVVTARRVRGPVQVRCDCGTELTINQPASLPYGNTASCGCVKRESGRNPNWRGGRCSHPLYKVWHDMIARCARKTHHAYARYGGRGITVCERWRNDFWAFVADVGERPEGHSLDRINNDGPYAPDNVRWATPSQQSLNRRPFAHKISRDADGRFTPGSSA